MSSHDHASLLKLYNQKLSSNLGDIDSEAVQILKRLKQAQFQAYLVGGGVRDLLVDLKPKDFDIATNALPNEVKKKVPYCFIIGRRFKLVHARRGDKIYEIATFRRAATDAELQTTEQDARHLVEENFFGNIEEDSFRRDFTINSLYYDPIDRVIVDHCHGLLDIRDRTLKMIGDPKTRLLEDPVRILRAIRLSQKLNFSIEPELRTQISDLKEELRRCVLPRRREEWLKFFRLKYSDLALIELYDLGVFEILLPSFQNLFSDEKGRQDFLSYLQRLQFCGFNFSDPTELFSGVLASFLQAKFPQGYKLDELSETEGFQLFVRDELGIFKAEIAIFLQAMQFINILKKIDTYRKKGPRRQQALLAHPNFSLSLKLGFLTHQFTPSEFVFWLEELDKKYNPSNNLAEV